MLETVAPQGLRRDANPGSQKEKSQNQARYHLRSAVAVGVLFVRRAGGDEQAGIHDVGNYKVGGLFDSVGHD